jgi:hypothetical protein
MQQKTIDNDPPHAKAIGRQQARRLELQRVTQENQRLLKRIQETEPCYNHLKWEDEARKREQIMANMSEFSETNMKVPMPTISAKKSQSKSQSFRSNRIELEPL